MAAHRVLLLAGGQSDEHEISLLSARNVAEGLRRAGFRLSLRVITRLGRLLSEDASQTAIQSGSSEGVEAGTSLAALSDATRACDIVFPLLHGPMGEDGCIQGLLKHLDVPFVGSDVLGSSLCMDKAMSKEVLKNTGIAQVAYRLVRGQDWKTRPDAIEADIAAHLPLPWFVKPANLGSSVGIAKVKTRQDLRAALENALAYDRRVIVEAGINGVRELEVAVLGNDAPRASCIGEITYQAEFYDYETKYTEGRSRMVVPADIPKEVSSRMQALATRAFVALDCAGLARVDFFLRTSDNALFLNELNTMPGFTPFSMYPSMWRESGLSYEDLLGCLIDLGLERGSERRRALPHGPTAR